jgi:hypothetical protein
MLDQIHVTSVLRFLVIVVESVAGEVFHLEDPPSHLRIVIHEFGSHLHRFPQQPRPEGTHALRLRRVALSGPDLVQRHLGPAVQARSDGRFQRRVSHVDFD